MIIPCIDLMDGKAVQLVQGERKALEVGAIQDLLQSFQDFPLIHVIDLDAAKEVGNNQSIIENILNCRAARVGGGIRTVDQAKTYLDKGARQIIIGTAAFSSRGPNRAFLSALSDSIDRERICIALDSRKGRIVVRGWKESLNFDAASFIEQLEPFCDSFLCTYVDTEGTMSGTNLAWFSELHDLTKNQIIAAGGFHQIEELRRAGAIGIDVALGMSIYTGALALPDLVALNNHQETSSFS